MTNASNSDSLVTIREIVSLTSEFSIEGLDQCFIDILSSHLSKCEIGIFAGSSKGVNSLSGLILSTSPKRKMRGDLVMILGPRRTARKLVIDGKVSKVAEKKIKPIIQIYENQLKHIKRSIYDNLTNLLNREAFEDLFRQRYEEFEDDRRSKLKKSALALLDVDHFKKINDKYGHVIGDEVLLLLARIMKTTLRKSDMVFRLGGEEFVIVLHGVNQSRAMDVLGKLKEKISSRVFPHVGQVTASMGVALMDESGSSDLFLGRSDAALYHAKENGRNMVCSYETLREDDIIEAVENKESNVELFRIQKKLI